MNARFSKKKKTLLAVSQLALQITVVPFVASECRTTTDSLPLPSLSLSTHKKRRSWVSQVTHQIVLWHEQIHWGHQCQMSSVHIQQALNCDWWKSHRVVVADVHVLDQHLTCLQHLFLAGHSLWIPLDHQTVQFRNVCRSRAVTIVLSLHQRMFRVARTHWRS